MFNISTSFLSSFSLGNICPWQLDNIGPVVHYLERQISKREDSRSVRHLSDTSKYLKFVFWVKTHVDEELYNVTKNQRFHFDYFDCTLRVINYGKSSFQKQLSLVNPVTKQELLRSTQCLVFVKSDDRRPTSIPENVRARLEKANVPSVPTNKIHRLEPPANVYELIVEVTSSSIDIYQHMNHSEYSKLCFDCAAFAVKKNFYRFFKDDIEHYHVRDTLKLHAGECKMGDKLRIITWQEKARPEMVYFLVYKNDEKLAIFELTCIFYKKSLSAPKL